MDSKLSRFCDGLLEIGWLLAIIAVPLFFNIHSERVFEPDKLVLLRTIALFMAAIMVVRFIDQRGWENFYQLEWQNEKSLWRLPFILPLTFLILVYLVSTLFSLTPRASWAGSYQRLQGTYTTISYIVIFIAAITTIRDKVQINRIITAVIISTIPVSLYGLLQHFGLDPLPWGGDVEARIAGHLGNSIFIAAYLIMAVPLTLGRVIDAFTNILSDEYLSFSDVSRSSIYIFTLAIQILAIYWSGSRGPFIGLAVALFSFMLILLVSLRDSAENQDSYHIRDFLTALAVILPAVMALLFSNFLNSIASPLTSFFTFFGLVGFSVIVILVLVAVRRGWKWLWLSWLLLTIVVAGWLLLFNIPSNRMETLQSIPGVGSVFKAQLAWKELPTIGSYGKMLDPSQTVGREKSNRVRVLIWQGVVDLITPHEPIEFPDGSVDRFNFLRPLIGYGPESMYVVYNKFYPPELATVEARNASPDRAHNETFDALVITGLAGLLAWQALYISVFYYGFKYLGVVGSKRDRNLLIGGWIGGALLGAMVTILFLDPIYLGVAIPIGTIVALIAYLFYFALFSRSKVSKVNNKSELIPFLSERLLMNAMLAGVLAHYVEIHFGIAISVTRLYFFLFIALMFLIDYKLPQIKILKEEARLARRKRRTVKRKPGGDSKGQWGPVFTWAFLLAFMVGILGFEFTNFVLPPDQILESGADLTVSDIFQQSFFINPINNFIDSPFIYLMIVLSWGLGVVLSLSEMVKQGVINFNFSESIKVAVGRKRAAAILLVLLALGGIGWRFFGSISASASASLGQSLILLGAVICLWAAVQLLQKKGSGHAIALGVGAALFIISLPLLIAGAWMFSLIMIAASSIIIYLLWDKTLKNIVLIPILIGTFSLIVGFAYAFLHATLLREALLYLVFYQDIEPISTLYRQFFRPQEPVTSVPALRVIEAKQSMRLLTTFYMFMFITWISAALALVWRGLQSTRVKGSAYAFVTAAVGIILVLILISETNVKVVQADMVYKRGKPFDNNAMVENDPLNWDVAIAIYEEALELAPWEDFYYLFLGRALLERSAVGEDVGQQTTFLRSAENQLLKAQELNPLNTDHTANLARLNTRWTVAAQGETEESEQLRKADDYYQTALTLSPQNSIIRNEYARLALELNRDCVQSIDIYQESLAIDPFFPETYFAFTDALVSCASAQNEENAQNELYTMAAQTLEEGLTFRPRNARAWLQLGQINQRIEQFEQALLAFERAREEGSGSTIPTWNIDFLEASIYRDMGEIGTARQLAERALSSAPDDVLGQIEAFIAELAEE